MGAFSPEHSMLKNNQQKLTEMGAEKQKYNTVLSNSEGSYETAHGRILERTLNATKRTVGSNKSDDQIKTYRSKDWMAPNSIPVVTTLLTIKTKQMVIPSISVIGTQAICIHFRNLNTGYKAVFKALAAWVCSRHCNGQCNAYK